MRGPLGAFFAHWAQGLHGDHGPERGPQHGPQHGWQHGGHEGWQHGWFGGPTREQMIEHLERYQRHLEEELGAVAAKIMELRDAGSQTPGQDKPSQQPPPGTTAV